MSFSNSMKITHFSPMTTSLADRGGGQGEAEEEGGAMYALRGENLFNIAGGSPEDRGRETSLYIVSEGVWEYSEYSNGRKKQYLVERGREEEEEEGGGFSSPSSPNNSQALITHKVSFHNICLVTYYQGLKGLSHEIDFDNIAKN